MIAVSVKPCIVNVLHIPFQNTPLPGAFDLYFTFLVILPDAGAISTSAEFLFSLSEKFFHHISSVCITVRDFKFYMHVQNDHLCY